MDCAEHSYRVTHSLLSGFTFLVVCADVRDFMAGSKIKLKIGNPNSIGFSGLKYEISFGKDTSEAREI